MDQTRRGQGEEMQFSGDAAAMEPETMGAERRKGRSPGEGSQEHRRRESAEAGGDGKGCRKRAQNCGVGVEQENAACYNKTK